MNLEQGLTGVGDPSVRVSRHIEVNSIDSGEVCDHHGEQLVYFGESLESPWKTVRVET